jgi:hypothetical protein
MSRLLCRTKGTVRRGTVVGGAVYFSRHFEGPTNRLKVRRGREPPAGIESMYTLMASGCATVDRTPFFIGLTFCAR